MRVLVDADACPVVRQTEEICREFHVPVTLLCDSAHVLRSSYSEVRTVGPGRMPWILHSSISPPRAI